MNARVVAIIQARMASSRLPGKVLKDLEGVAMLGRVVERTRRAETAEDVILATTTDASDDAIVEYCHTRDIPSIRGSHFDVLDRYYDAAQETKADVVIRITADCPLIDPTLIDDAVHLLLGSGEPRSRADAAICTDFDLVANRLPPPWKRTYPIGLDTEVCTFEALEKAWREAREPGDREHVVPYMYKGVNLVPRGWHVSNGRSPRGFRVAVLNNSDDFGAYRWTVDTADDLEFVRQVYRHFGGRCDFSWLDVLRLVHSHPEMMSINAGVRHKTLEDLDERAPGADAS